MNPAVHSSLQPSRWVGPAFGLLYAALCAWLLAAAWLVNVETGDGYSVVANAHYFIGEGGSYFWQRGPLMAWLMMPAEWLARRLELAPLDVRPHHYAMALLHAAYLVWTWRLTVKLHGAVPASLLAWLAAVPTLVFFSYAPFISHDLLPGAAVLQLCWLAHAHGTRPSWGTALAFAALAAALALLKQTYALAPAAILLARLLGLWSLRRLDAAQWRAGLQLAALTLVAGAACWLVYGWLVAARFPDFPWWQRPLRIVHEIAHAYPPEVDLRTLFYPWIYLRNASAYGIAAMTLVLPGLWLAWRSADLWQRQLALGWLLLLAAMAWTPFKEVRYLAYLAPMTACLLVPVFAWTLRRGRAWAAALLAVLMVDAARALPEAARIGDPWYQQGVTGFFEPLAADARSGQPLFFVAGWLSFIAPDRWAFYADPFHRIVEIQIEQVRQLYGLPRERAFMLRLDKLGEALRASPEGAAFLVQSRFLARTRPYGSDTRSGLWLDFHQFHARSVDVDFVLRDGRYAVESAPPGPLMLAGAGTAGTVDVLRFVDSLPSDQLQRFIDLRDAALPPRLRVRVLRILRECTLDGCWRRAD